MRKETKPTQLINDAPQLGDYRVVREENYLGEARYKLERYSVGVFMREWYPILIEVPDGDSGIHFPMRSTPNLDLILDAYAVEKRRELKDKLNKFDALVYIVPA